MKVISFFSGIGGLDQGFLNEGFEVVLASDYWSASENSFKNNHPEIPFLNKDIREISKEDLLNSSKYNSISDIDVVIGGPPCQGFSRLNNNKLDSSDPRNNLFMDYIRMCSYINPKFVLMENVPDLLSRTNSEGKPIINLIINEFKEIGYTNVNYTVLNSADYGTPQRRKRFFLVASKNINSSFSFPTITHSKKPKMDIYGNITKKWVSSKEILNSLEPSKLDNSETKINDKTKELILNIPPGGYYNDLPDELKVKKIRSGKLVTVKRYGSHLRRLHPDLPSLTITNNPVYHFFENRQISVLEKALLCGFDENIIIEGNSFEKNQLLGNCVPVNIAQALAKNFIKYL